MKRYVRFGRVSSREQMLEGYSMAFQEEEIRAGATIDATSCRIELSAN